LRQKGYSFEFNPDFAAAWKDSSWRVIEQQLQEMREIGRANSFAVFLVAVPYAEQFRPDYLSRNRDHVLKPQRALGSICARLGIAFLDLYPRLDRKAHFDSDRVHLTEAGRQHAAEAIAAFLKEKRLIPAE
jgi:hypothetical protein